MRLLRLVPDNTKLHFMRYWRYMQPLSIVLSVGSILLFVLVGPNYGIDFRGGSAIEITTKDGKPADLAALRSAVSDLNLGDVQIQEFGKPNDVLIRVARQDGGEDIQQQAVFRVRDALGQTYDIRRTEVVGPRVSGELTRNGTIGLLVTLAAILVYVWFRFEWQFAVGAIIATLHDVILTLGIYVLVPFEFNLSSIAAILTIVGYSLNDTVVVYDRIRENLRKYKRMPLPDLIDLSINETLGRTLITALTTMIALGSLYIFGGEVIRSFTFAMIFGVLIGTFSSIYIAAPVLIYFKLRSEKKDEGEGAATASGAV